MTTPLPKYIISGSKIFPTPQRISASINNVLRKEPVFENEFIKIRNMTINVKLVSYNPTTKVLNYELHGPEDMNEKIDSGEIVIDDNALNKALKSALIYKMQYLARITNPGKHLHFE